MFTCQVESEERWKIIRLEEVIEKMIYALLGVKYALGIHQTQGHLTLFELRTCVAILPVHPTKEILFMEKLYSLLIPFYFPSEVNKMIYLMVACDYKMAGDAS